MSNKIAVVGYGKMGRLIDRLAPEFGFDVALRLDSRSNANAAAITAANFSDIPTAIEFSNPTAAPVNIERLAALGVNVVSGTTGWSSQQARVHAAVAESGSALVTGSNFSIGVQIFLKLAACAGSLFAHQSDYEAWAWEIHHSAKKDAPSGTLLTLVDRVKKSGYARPIDAGSNRAGAHPGTHELGFDSPADTITIRHTARNREGFARGALRAAQWIQGKKGVFDFSEIIGELSASPDPLKQSRSTTCLEDAARPWLLHFNAIFRSTSALCASSSGASSRPASTSWSRAALPARAPRSRAPKSAASSRSLSRNPPAACPSWLARAATTPPK